MVSALILGSGPIFPRLEVERTLTYACERLKSLLPFLRLQSVTPYGQVVVFR